MLMTQHVSAGLAPAWRAQAAQQGLPAASPVGPRAGLGRGWGGREGSGPGA